MSNHVVRYKAEQRFSEIERRLQQFALGYVLVKFEEMAGTDRVLEVLDSAETEAARTLAQEAIRE